MKKNACISSMAIVSMCVAIIAVSSWITIPFTINFTLQTLAILVISVVFDLKKSFLSVLIYILIGLCGIPIFSGFGAGPAILIGPTGGYIIGFLFIPIVIKLILNGNKKSKKTIVLAMIAGLASCYLLGTFWYCLVYGALTTAGLWGAICVCVFPFIIPDALKILIAVIISARINNINVIHNSNRR